MNLLRLLSACLALGAAPGLLPAPSAARQTLTLEGARQVLAAAVNHARAHESGGSIAIVDDGGHLILCERLDGTFPASASIAIGKARTAALFRRPTRAFEELIGKGRTAMVAIAEVADFTPLEGGVPIFIAGEVAGAIGVSGATSAREDADIANAGAEALKPTAAAPGGAATRGAGPPAVTYLERETVAAAFTRGEPLVEVEDYKVHASRRDGPGMAEVHERDTDVIYVLEGSATLVTGGALVEGKETAPGEVRGKSIAGGESRRLAKGDLIVVPRGTPHWFQEVPAPLTYYVVKVTGLAAGGGRS